MVTKQDIFKMLRNFGIKNTDCVLMHSSLKKIGETEGRAEGLLDAFTEYLNEGLFIVPTHTWANVNKDNPVFEVEKTVPCIGKFAEICAAEAIKRDNAVRSLHPTHSVAAFGKRAAEFVIGEENSKTPAPPGGVWSRLYAENAKILLVGVGFERNTYIHAIDEEIDLPGRLSEDKFDIEIISGSGEKIAVTDFAPHKGAYSEFFPNYEKPLQRLGTVSYGKLGNADVICFDVKKSADAIRDMWKKADFDFCTELMEIPESFYM